MLRGATLVVELINGRKILLFWKKVGQNERTKSKPSSHRMYANWTRGNPEWTLGFQLITMASARSEGSFYERQCENSFNAPSKVAWPRVDDKILFRDYSVMGKYQAFRLNWSHRRRSCRVGSIVNALHPRDDEADIVSRKWKINPSTGA